MDNRFQGWASLIPPKKGHLQIVRAVRMPKRGIVEACIDLSIVKI